jgi:3'-5' exoribonuclease
MTFSSLLDGETEILTWGICHLTCKSERDIVIVASLLHDIGKVKTLNEHIQLTNLGQLIEHDDLTLDICAEPLKQLEKENITIANILRHCWTCASPNARYGYKPQYRIAKYVQQADNLSALG